MTGDDATNTGMQQRALKSQDGTTVQTLIPLNRYSFFENLFDKLLPPLQLEFEIVLQNDREMISQNDGTARRIVVRKFELLVAKLKFTGEGQKLVNENYLRRGKMKYMKEVLRRSMPMRASGGTWMISDGVKKPKHVFVFFQQTRKQNNFRHNPYLFDTFDIDGDNTTRLATSVWRFVLP